MTTIPANATDGTAARPFVYSSPLFYIATFGEGAGLVLWLRYIDSNRFWPALVWLLAGFAVERAAVAIWIRRTIEPEAHLKPKPLAVTILGLAFATAVEITIWHLWRMSAAHWDIEIAGVLLFFMIHPLHAAEMAGVRRQPMLKFLIRPPTILFSFIEALGGSVWLALVRGDHFGVGVIALLAALSLEHVFQARELEEQGFRV